MAAKLTLVKAPRTNREATYEIVVGGELSARFASAFDGVTIRAEHGQSRLIASGVDQSRLYGILQSIQSLGLDLISVTPITEAEAQPPSASPEAAEG
jgi:hypothetical protein